MPDTKVSQLPDADSWAKVRESYRILDCGHPHVSRTPFSLVGLELNIWGLEEIRESRKPLVVLLAAHGRLCDEETMWGLANGVIGETNNLAKNGNRQKDLIVVTLEQRNHGKRTKDITRNKAYNENPTHFLDMAATVMGGTHDFSLIIDFLAAYLFPNGEKIIDEFMATGISLGGHVTWLCLRDEPRIRVGIPIIGLPYESFPYYMGPRAEKAGIPFKPPTYPASVVELFKAPTEDAYRNKKILTLHGADDPLVPFRQGQREIEQAQRNARGGEGEVEIWSEAGVGHACTPTMVKKAAAWIWKWGLSREGAKM